MPTPIADFIKERRAEKSLLLMTHIVLGDPSFEESAAIVDAMVSAGVDLVELQIAFSEPIADGPVILQANARALEHGATVEKAFEFAAKICKQHSIPFVFMTYYNILFRYGVEAFVARMAEVGVRGAIVPDLPPEEAQEYLAAMAKHGLDPIFIFSPNTSDERMERLAQCGRGLMYCVARKGVTGAETDFGAQLDHYLARCRRATKLPLALGFGVKTPQDIGYLRGRVDVAVVGSETIRILQRDGVGAVKPFLRALMQAQ
jgi:tryptophan synthase alpha chain